MSSSDAPLLVQKALANRQDLLARRLADSLESLARDLRSGEYAPGENERVLALLSTLARDAMQPEPGDRAETAVDVEAIGDPGAVGRTLVSIQELQSSLVDAALTSLDAPEGAADEISVAFERLREGQERLIEHWFANESLREAELLAQVFHDLRSPLTSVLFLSDALFSGQSGTLSDPQRRQVQLIYAASLTLLNLVENVLNSRNLEAGDVTPEHVPFSVSALTEEVERITRPLASQKRLSLEFHTDCQIARMGDPDALKRVLLNLVTNAISYTDEGGVTVRFQESEDELVLLVEDTGRGIDEEEIAELFTPFRIRSGSGPGRDGCRRFSGAGLGLSICHRLTRLMDGDIWVDTEAGEGSCFGVRVPCPPVVNADCSGGD